MKKSEIDLNPLLRLALAFPHKEKIINSKALAEKLSSIGPYLERNEYDQIRVFDLKNRK